MTAYIGQNVAGFEAALGGGDKGKAEAASLFGNLVCKVFCANGDPGTNEWASSLVGRTRQFMASGNKSHANDDWIADAMGLGSGAQTSGGFSEHFESEVQPSVFTGLRTGGPENQYLVDTIVFKSGKQFKSTGRTWLPVTFKQEAMQ